VHVGKIMGWDHGLSYQRDTNAGVLFDRNLLAALAKFQIQK
jgi:hypothetical protein